VNTAHVKQVLGRKTDKADARWLTKLMRYRLLQASFIPPAAQQDPRDLTRYRTQLVQERGRKVKPVQGVLEHANIRGAGVYPWARNAHGRLGGHGAALAGRDPALDGAAAARLAHFLAAALERSPAGHRKTAAPRARGAPARRTTWPPKAGAGLGAGRPGRRGDSRQAGAVPTLPAPVARRGSPAPAASSGRDPTSAAGDHRISVAPLGLPGVWRRDTTGSTTGGFGPRVQAVAALCTGAYHLSTRTTQSVLEDLFGLPVRLGTIADLEQATVRAVAEPVAAARASVQPQPAAYLDETGWREGQQRAWLWTAVPTWGTVVVVLLSRGGKVAQALLGERFWGWLVTDRWSASTWYPAWRRRVCWAHLLRDIEAMSERGGQSRAIGEAWRAQARQMFHKW
jgi:Transposase IS66 family/Transposase